MMYRLFNKSMIAECTESKKLTWLIKITLNYKDWGKSVRGNVFYFLTENIKFDLNEIYVLENK